MTALGPRIEAVEADVADLKGRLREALTAIEAAEDELNAEELYREIESAMSKVTVYTSNSRRMEAMHDPINEDLNKSHGVDLGGMAWGLLTAIECDQPVIEQGEARRAYIEALEAARTMLGDEWADTYHEVVEGAGDEYLLIGRLRRSTARSFATLWLRTTRELWAP